MKKEHMIGIAVLALFFISGLFKQKACQAQDSGDLTARPWYWPCPKGSATTTSASTD